MQNIENQESSNRDHEQLLILAQRRFSHLLRSLPVGIAVIRSDGNLEAVNGAVVRLLEYGERELAGQNLSVLFKQPLWKPESNIREWYESQLDQAIELEAQTKNGTTIPVDFTLNTLDTDTYDRFIAVIQDVTQRHNANKLKRSFLQMITHDIRSPLTNIVLFLDMLEISTECGNLSAFGQTRAAAAKQNVERILSLLSGLLELERIESALGHSNMESVSIVRLIDSSVVSVSEAADLKRIRIDVESEDIYVTGDYNRLEQVAVNLLSNAIDHSPAQQSLEVKAESTGTGIRISIRDHGPGVPDAEKRLVFDKFRQGARRKSQNFGLGLAICKEIVTQYKGTIGCDDAPGGGSVFWFELPHSQPE